MAATQFAPGDGVVIDGPESRTGIVNSSDAETNVAVVQVGTEEVEVAWSRLRHLIPTDEYVPGWWPYEPTTSQRADFAQWCRHGLTKKDHGVEWEAAWQRNWTRPGCGDWCCYIFECGNMYCDSCQRTVVWPRCPSCNKTFQKLPPGGICGGKDCGVDLTAVSFPERFVCSTRVSVACGPGDTKRLNPTFCAVFCESCWAQGVVHEHNDFVKIHVDGQHETGVTQAAHVQADLLLKDAAAWRQAFASLSLEVDHVLPPVPRDLKDVTTYCITLKELVTPALQRTSQQGEELTDALTFDDIEPGKEYVSPWPCGCVFLPSSFQSLVDSQFNTPADVHCPMHPPT